MHPKRCAHPLKQEQGTPRPCQKPAAHSTGHARFILTSSQNLLTNGHGCLMSINDLLENLRVCKGVSGKPDALSFFIKLAPTAKYPKSTIADRLIEDGPPNVPRFPHPFRCQTDQAQTERQATRTYLLLAGSRHIAAGHGPDTPCVTPGGRFSYGHW